MNNEQTAGTPTTHPQQRPEPGKLSAGAAWAAAAAAGADAAAGEKDPANGGKDPEAGGAGAGAAATAEGAPEKTAAPTAEREIDAETARGRDKVIAKLRETIPQLAETIQKSLPLCPTRMKTRMALVEPVIQDVLAFDLRNPFEVDPEAQEIVDHLAADEPTRSNWSAYALMQAAKPMMHVVTVPSGEALPEQAVMVARIPCIPTRTPIAWTNGLQWAFVVRTNDDDDADAVVAHDFDFSNYTLVDIDELATFTRESLSDEMASDRIYGVYAERRAAEWLARELQEPSTAFIELAVGACHPGRKTQSVVAAYAEAVPKAIETVLRNLRAGTETDIARRARPPEPDSKGRERLVGRIQGRVQKTGRGVGVARWLMETAAGDEDGRNALWATAGVPEHACLGRSLDELTESRRDRATKIAGTEIWFAAGASIRAMKGMLDDLMNRLPTTHRLLLDGYSVDVEKSPSATAAGREAGSDGQDATGQDAAPDANRDKPADGNESETTAETPAAAAPGAQPGTASGDHPEATGAPESQNPGNTGSATRAEPEAPPAGTAAGATPQDGPGGLPEAAAAGQEPEHEPERERERELAPTTANDAADGSDGNNEDAEVWDPTNPVGLGPSTGAGGPNQ